MKKLVVDSSRHCTNCGAILIPEDPRRDRSIQICLIENHYFHMGCLPERVRRKLTAGNIFEYPKTVRLIPSTIDEIPHGEHADLSEERIEIEDPPLEIVQFEPNRFDEDRIVLRVIKLVVITLAATYYLHQSDQEYFNYWNFTK